MKKTGLLWAVLLGTGISSFASDAINPREDRQALIKILVRKLSKHHLGGGGFNDSSSVYIWKQYIRNLDRQKNIFLKEDSIALSKYLYAIDEEMRNSSIEFYETIYGIYSKRAGEIRKLYAEVLSKPVSLSEKGSFDEGGNNQQFPATAETRTGEWKKQLQFLVFSKIMELKANPAFAGKNMAELESTARQKLLHTLELRYAGTDPQRTEEYRFAEYINIILASLDPHTRWTPPVNAKPQAENFGKRYYGIGVALEDINGRTYFNKVVTGGTAYASGKIRENDELLQVGNSEGEMADVSGLNVIEIAQFIRGDKHSDIWVTVKYPEGGIETIHLKRDEIVDKEVRARSAVINRESGKIGYINLSRFYSTGEMMTGELSCSADMKKEIEKLKKEAVKGIIVDLRNNPGGDFAQALQIIGLFLPGGPVAHLKAGNKISTNELPADNVPVYDGPPVVMINGRSASASELFSAAMQDYGRGLLIGSNTYGKGTAQSTFPIGRVDVKTPNSPVLDLGSLVITHSKFYRSSGASTQLKGVKPDIELPSVFARGYASESNQPSALPWDEIPVTAVKKVQEPKAIESLKEAVELQLGRSQELNQLRLKLDSIRKDNESSWSMNWDTFMQQWQQRRTRVNDLNLLLRLPAAKQMNISPSGAEDDTIEKWRKGLCGDLYLSEAVQSMEIMISRL